MPQWSSAAASRTPPRATGLPSPPSSDPPRSEALTAAFESFSLASRSLEGAYQALRDKVDELAARLRETEGRLARSLDENRHLAERAERSSRLEAMGRMAAEIAHEVRNPLGSLELTASLLRDELDGDPDRSALALSMLEGIRAVTRVTGNLLSFTRSVTPRVEALDARRVLARTRALIAPACSARGVTARVRAPRGLGVAGDPELVQQVLLNLAQNALEAVDSGAEILLTARGADSGDVELRVVDAGAGMDAETLARVFDPFFTTKPRGTGLGLSVSHRLAEAQGGRIEIESAPGSGTAAALVLPAASTGAVIDGDAR